MPEEAQNLGDLLDAALPVALRHVPLRIRDVARDLDVRAALVGGVPRDVLRLHLGQVDRQVLINELRDVDVVVEGDGVLFAYELRRRLPGELTVNAEFHTATLRTDDPLQIDVTSARIEEYPIPGRLPVVDISGVTLEQDMARRDFSVNAVAVDIADDYGRVIDPLGGAGDIAARILRVLHAESFRDDPTRLFRALRYSLRLNYDLEEVTREHFSAAVDEAVLDHLTPERIRYELQCIAGEPRWVEAWQVMHISRLARAVSVHLSEAAPALDLADARALDIAISNRQDLMDQEGLEPWLVRTAWVLSGLRAGLIEPVGERLGLFARHRRWITGCREVLAEACPRLSQTPAPSAIVRLLEHHPRQAVALAAFVYQPRTEEGVSARKALLRYLEEYAQVRCELSGEEMLALGLGPGPELGQARDEMRYLRLDGAIMDVEQEREYIRGIAAQHDGEESGQPGDEQAPKEEDE
jgi:tRNA nucleotidyltransferase (CCA-adding enzyme)